MKNKIIEYPNKPTLSHLAKSVFIYKEPKNKVSSFNEDQIQNKLNQRFRAEY